MATSKLKLAFVCSEAVPFIKTGGLADVTSALARTLHVEGHDVRLFLPLYRQSKQASSPLSMAFDAAINLKFGSRDYRVSVIKTTLPESDVPTYLLACPNLFERDQIYTQDADEPVRFAALARAAIEACQHLGFGPDIFHCHDWHSSLLPLYLRTYYQWDKLFSGSRTLLTIHNMGYQGVFSADVLNDLGFKGQEHLFEHQDLNQHRINYLKTGVLYADRISTVSPTYAKEISHTGLGMGLEGLLRARQDSVVGILNGIDDEEWNPRTDPHLPHRYSLKNLAAKGKCKRHLLEEVKLPYDPKAPTFGWISRLTHQKGIDHAIEVLPRWLPHHDSRWVVLGSGESKYETFWRHLQRQFPDKVWFYSGYNESLAHLIEAGSDIFVMPSKYEPCGLNQMYSQRYGTVPIVRATGGLADSVIPFDPDTETGTGIVFQHDDPMGLEWAITQAVQLFRKKKLWNGIKRRGMQTDFSWHARAPQYLALYRSMLTPRPAIKD